jgi:hypothetical protein
MKNQMQLWKKIPVDVYINHIIPYTYIKIDPNLLNDIRSFFNDYNTIINYYYFDMNEYCLLIDIILFFNKKPLSESINHLFIDFLNRNIIFNKLSYDKKISFIKNNFCYNVHSNTQQKNKFLLALLTPVERANFINKYIIEYYE